MFIKTGDLLIWILQLHELWILVFGWHGRTYSCARVFPGIPYILEKI